MEMENTYIPMFQVDFAFVLAMPDALPQWRGMLQIFKPFVWLAGVALSTFTCMTIWLIAKRKTHENDSYRKIKNIVFIIVPSMFNAVPNVPPNSNLIRFIYVLWLFFCLNWTSAYTSSLFTMISTTLHPHSTVDNTIK